jgi:hypothetical protein
LNRSTLLLAVSNLALPSAVADILLDVSNGYDVVVHAGVELTNSEAALVQTQGNFRVSMSRRANESVTMPRPATNPACSEPQVATSSGSKGGK